MKEVVTIDKLAAAKALMNPIRVTLLQHLEEPRTCRELAERMNLTQQRINHHLKEMLKAGAIRIARSERRRNLIEATYERVGKTLWFSPDLARASGSKGRAFRDQMSLHNLLVLAETLQEDAAGLLGRSEGREVPSLGLDAEVVLRDAAERQEFTRDVLRALHQVIEKYQAPAADGERYKVMITAYPHADGKGSRQP